MIEKVKKDNKIDLIVINKLINFMINKKNK